MRHIMSSGKFHLSADQVARQCRAATPESCTVSGEHFDTKEEANVQLEKNNESKRFVSVAKSLDKINTHRGALKYASQNDKDIKNKMKELKTLKDTIYKKAVTGEPTAKLAKEAIIVEQDIKQLDKNRKNINKKLLEFEAERDRLQKEQNKDTRPDYSRSSCGGVSSGGC